MAVLPRIERDVESESRITGFNLTIARIAVVAAIVVVAMAVRFVPQVNRVPLETGFGTYVDWGTFWLLKTDHIYEPGDVTEQEGVIAVGSYAGVEYGNQDVFAKTLNGMFARATGYDDVSERLRIQRMLPWAGALFIPLVAVLTYFLFLRSTSSRLHSVTDVAAVALFAALPSANLIAQSLVGGYGDIVARGLMLALLGLHIARLSSRQRVRFAETISFLVIFAGFQLFYHTTVLYFVLVYIASVAGTALIRWKIPDVLNTVMLVACLAIATHLYINTGFLTSYTSIARDVITSRDPADTYINLVGVVPDRAFWLSIVNLVNYALIAALAGLVFLRLLPVLRRRTWPVPDDAVPDAVVAVLLLSLVPLAIVLYIWAGLAGVYGRLVATMLPLLTIVATGYLLANPRQHERTAIYGLVLASSIVAVFSFSQDSYVPKSILTAEEARANTYLVAATDTSDVIFTDFRMGAPLLYNGLYGMTGVDVFHRVGDEALKLNESVYQNDDIVAATGDLDRAVGCRCYYLMTSAEQARNGVADVVVGFPRAEPDFQEKFVASAGYDLLYSSGEVNVFRRVPADR